MGSGLAPTVYGLEVIMKSDSDLIDAVRAYDVRLAAELAMRIKKLRLHLAVLKARRGMRGMRRGMK